MALTEDKKFNIKTPHAAVIIWNYNERGTDGKFYNDEEVSQTILSTVSCVAINTTKTKSNPVGSFQFVLAPTKNWTAEITSGSWCAILMSATPITKSDFQFASKSKLKMIGKIETVRVDVKVNDDASVSTFYTVSGVDWGHMFNNIIYIDNYVASPDAPTLGDGASNAMQKMLNKKLTKIKDFTTLANIRSLIKLFGQPFPRLSDMLNKQGLLVNAIYSISIPSEMKNYLKITSPTKTLNDSLEVIGGSLIAPDTYTNESESYGFINPFSLQGQHTFWQVLMEHSNPTLNEMVTEMRWEGFGPISRPSFTLYNRIRPFSTPKLNFDEKLKTLQSQFHFLRKVKIEKVDVISLNAGTNWRDKYNFIEIKLDVPNYQIFSIAVKKDGQKFDNTAFNREGFRPLISTTRQLPLSIFPSFGTQIDLSMIGTWSKLLREWYFDTHRMLNGTIVFSGQDDYIGVGENIQFSADLINATNNMRSFSSKTHLSEDVLAHVESVSHSFSVTPEGARSFITTVQFVRGIFVNPITGLANPIDSGKMDPKDGDISNNEIKNKNVIRVSTKDDPD